MPGYTSMVLSNTTDHADQMEDFKKKIKSLVHLGYGPDITGREIADKILSLDKNQVLREVFHKRTKDD